MFATAKVEDKGPGYNPTYYALSDSTKLSIADDMVNFAGGSAINYAAYAEYKAKLNDDLQLNVMLSGINSAWDSKTEDEKTTALKMGGAARVSMLKIIV